MNQIAATEDHGKTHIRTGLRRNMNWTPGEETSRAGRRLFQDRASECFSGAGELYLPV